MKCLLSVCLLFVLSVPLWGAEIPKLMGPVNDYANVLTGEEVKKLTDFLLSKERKTSNQIVILTVKSLDGNTIADFAEKVFNTWKLGKKGKDNGILIVHATKERKIRIEVGHGLEGVLPDAVTSRIIRNEMAPKFKAKDFSGGFMAAIVAIDKAIAGEFQAEDKTKEGGGWPLWVILLIILLIFGIGGLVLFLIMKAGGLGDGGGWSSGGGFFGGLGGGSSDSGSSGGDYSGGGGGSGGGGASGSY